METGNDLGDKDVFSPGQYIKEFIEESGISQHNFAKEIGVSTKELSNLIKGKRKISKDLALKLSNTIGTSPEYWLNLQEGDS